MMMKEKGPENQGHQELPAEPRADRRARIYMEMRRKTQPLVAFVKKIESIPIDIKDEELATIFGVFKNEMLCILGPESHEFRQLNRWLADLQAKHRFILEYRSGETSRSYLEKKYMFRGGKQIRLNSSDVSETLFDAFSIVTIIEFQAFTAIAASNKTLGFHIPNSPFCMVKNTENDEGIERTIRHEKVHNLTEVTEAYGDINKELGAINAGWVENFFNETILGVHSIAEAYRVIDRRQSEIVAELENFLERREYIKLEEGTIDEKFDLYTGHFSAAGNDTKEIVMAIHKKAQSLRNNKKLDELLTTVRSIKKLFVAMADSYCLAMDVADKIGDDAYEEVRMLAMILRPSTFRHLPGYLEHVYPEKYAEVTRSNGK